MIAFDERLFLRMTRRTEVHLDAQTATEAHQRGRKITARWATHPTGVAVQRQTRRTAILLQWLDERF